MIALKCRFCQKEFTAHPSQKRSYCSWRCKREGSRKTCPVSKDWLQKEYLHKGRSRPSIARELGESELLVSRWLDRLGIKKRRRYESRLKPNLVCLFCKSAFHRSKANIRGDNNYCSRRCMSMSFMGRPSAKLIERVFRKCKSCKSLLSLPKWRLEPKKMYFCNRSCFGKWKSKNWKGSKNPCWRGGKKYYYGPSWNEQARKARRRDGHCCKNCGVSRETEKVRTGRGLHVHHIKPFRLFEDYRKANRLVNLVCLCEVCHTTMEHISKHGKVSDWDSLKRAYEDRSRR